MPTTKLIYGAGRIPKASEFALGEIIVNVDDSRVFSKSKQNVVFEIGGGGTIITPPGFPIDNTSTKGFTTASISASGFFTSANTSNLIISGGTGVRVTTSSNNHIIITATGEAEATVINALTASYVQIAQSASYVSPLNIQGTLFDLESGGDQGNILFNTPIVNTDSQVSAFAVGLGVLDDAEFAQVSSSGNLFASLSLDDTSHFKTVVYNSSSGKFFFTGSYGGGGGGSTPTLQLVTDQGSSTTTAITASIISASGDVFVKRLRLSSGQDTNVSGIIFDEQAGNSGFINDDGTSLQIGYNDADILTISSSAGPGGGDIKLLVNGGTRIANGILVVEGDITSSGQLSIGKLGSTNGHITASGNISASGTIFGSKVGIGTNSPIQNLHVVGNSYIDGYITATGNLNVSGNSTLGNNTNDFTHVKGNLTASGDISASGLLFASASKPTHTNSIVAVVYNTASGEFHFTGSYGNASIVGSNYHIPYFDANGQLDEDSDLKFLDYTGASQGYKILRLGSSNPTQLFTNSVRALAITSSIIKAADSSGVTLRFGERDILVAKSDRIDTTEDIFATGSVTITKLLKLKATGSSTSVSTIAGALMYSASNEFYLGFS